MFDSSRPPLLVQPVSKDYITLFTPYEGYNVHFISEDQALVSYRDGWIFPLSLQHQKYISAEPLLMVKDSGEVTSSTSTTAKGYAHIFCRENGQELLYSYKLNVFPEFPKVEWMFVQDTAIMIWFQYGCKTQFLGGSGHDVERIYYGKLLIRKFEIKKDIAPGFDKKADIAAASSRLIRVESTQIYNDGWNVNDDNPEKYLCKVLTANGLDCYKNAVIKAFSMSSGS